MSLPSFVVFCCESTCLPFVFAVECVVTVNFFLQVCGAGRLYISGEGSC